MEMLDKAKTKHIAAPGINWLIATIYEAGAFGYSFEKTEQVGCKKELEAAIKALKEMHRRGITVLPGGDYGFAWTPHGMYARDLEHFVKLLDFTPMKSIVAATAGVAKLFMREDELGKIKPGYYADCILVDGDPVKDITVLQDHDKLDIIMINGKFHKASYKEFLRTEVPQHVRPEAESLTNYVVHRLEDGTMRTRVGHLNTKSNIITLLSFASGTPLENLYQVIEIGQSGVVAGGEPFELNESIKILPPISGRDVLAVGKNHPEHAKEFNASGYDASDKVDMPSHPVIFTKRATSIIANEEDVLLHENFTRTLDYEGEIGVIIGYTINNDVTAREKQRDHEQFYVGKSADTLCPIGPVAVPVDQLPKVLTITTRVNSERRQQGTTDDLIFSVPTLIKTLSESQTLRPGDVIATGPPAGVGFGTQPPTFLKPGDVIEISVTGLGTLGNRVARADASNHVAERVQHETSIPISNLALGGFGGSKSFFNPLLSELNLKDSAKYTSLLYDFEGDGLSPTRADSTIAIASLAEDLHQVTTATEMPINAGVTLIAHGLGCFVAELLASQHPNLAQKLVLLGPPPCPLPQAGHDSSIQRAANVRAEGMKNVLAAVPTAATSQKTRKERPIAFEAVRMSLLSQDPEGYAKACTALATAKDLDIDFAKLKSEVLIVAGEEDKVNPMNWAEKLNGTLVRSQLEKLPDVGHWHCFEDIERVAGAVRRFL